MAIALVSHTLVTPSGSSGGTSPSIDTTGANLILISSADSDSTVPSVSDNKGNTYTNRLIVADGSFQANILWECLNPTVGTGHTFTIGGGSLNQSCAIAAFSGVKTSSAFDQHSTNHNSSSVTIAPGSITPSANNSLVITTLGTSFVSSPVFTISGGFTITDQLQFSPGNYYGSGLAYLIQTTATAENPTWTGTAASPLTLTSTIASYLPNTSSGANLTGASSTSAAGSFVISASSTIGLTGVSGTSHIGTFTSGASAFASLVGAYATGFVGSLFSIANLLNIPITTIMNTEPIPMAGMMSAENVPMIAPLPSQVPLDCIMTLNPIPMSGTMINAPVPGQVVFP